MYAAKPLAAGERNMRRLILEEPFSMTSIWGRRFATFALALALISIIMARAQIVDMSAALTVFGAAILIACLAGLLAVTGAVIIWRSGRRGLGVVVATLFMAVLLLAYPGYLALQATRLPLLKDVSTDLIDPPDFSRSSRAIAARSGAEHGPIIDAWRNAQRIAYPNVQPILLDLDSDEAWPLVLKAVAARGWTIIEQTRPGGRSGIGRIDAIDRTVLMGFSDDVTIRVRPLAGQTRIDVRSASRIGRHDFGSNARRIVRFAQEVQTQLDAR
jgi:uncharacterized protein (DUF1499 family)